MANVSLSNQRHNFDKGNLITKKDRNGFYDVWQCTNCGIKGKRYGFEDVISINFTKKNIHLERSCNIEDKWIGKLVEIRYCNGNGNRYSNIKPNTMHVIIQPPNYNSEHKELNGVNGVWIMGIGEPVVVIWGEFIIDTEFERTFK